MRHAHGASIEAHVQALVGQALQAVPARPQGRLGLTATLSPHADAGDILRHGRHDTGDLVAEDHRFLDADRAEPAMLEVVQIRAANAARGHADEHLARTDLAGVLLVEPRSVGA
jgi:hypothetical protein